MKQIIVSVACFLLLLLGACRVLDEGTGDVSIQTPTASRPSETNTPIPSPTTRETFPTPISVETEPAASPDTETPTMFPTATPADAPDDDVSEIPLTHAAVTSISLHLVLSETVTNPIYITHAFDDRLFVVEQAGRIRILEDAKLVLEPFLDMRDRVGSDGREQGLLSMAFQPGYNDPESAGYGRFFVNYTDLQGNTVVSEFRVSSDNPNQAVVDSEMIILRVDQPYGNHNGGQLQFGPDGFLYVGMGDGGSGGDPLGNGQNPSSLLGAVLRLHVDSAVSGEVSIPDDNPFLDDGNSREEVWAIGLRNPWRFSFDRSTGDLYIADVGQNMWEEVNFQAAGSSGGKNYGWNIMEGTHCFRDANCDVEGLERPVFEYDHGQGCSITGGYVYRGSDFPELSGNYFVGDFCSGSIWSLFRNQNGSWTSNRVLDSGLQISSFGEGADGELYVLDYGSGRIFQVRP